MYENLLASNLFKRRDQLLSNIDELGMSERRQEFESKSAEFEQATAGMEATKKRCSGLMSNARGGISGVMCRAWLYS